jgi:Family of unknown function (DUF6248)
MNPETAAWVRTFAWRDHHRTTTTEIPTFYRQCACQGGPCGHCTHNRHHACTHEHHPPAEHPAAYLTNPRGHVLAEIWETGHHHTWTCPCKTSGHGQQAHQLALF